MDLRERGGAERRHPWEVSRSRFFRRLVGAHADLGAVDSVLDVGAGDGWFAQELLADLRPDARVVCWDVHYGAAELASAPEGVTRTATRPSGAFALVTALDVLEHVDDDLSFLRDQLVPTLAAGGIAVLSVPAHAALFSDHDRMLEHRRRYRPDDFRRLVGAHLDIVAHGSLFASLIVPRLAQVGLERAGRHRSATGVGRWNGGAASTAAITAALDADARAGQWLGRHGVPVPGLSTWVVARLPGVAP